MQDCTIPLRLDVFLALELRLRPYVSMAVVQRRLPSGYLHDGTFVIPRLEAELSSLDSLTASLLVSRLCGSCSLGTRAYIDYAICRWYTLMTKYGITIVSPGETSLMFLFIPFLIQYVHKSR